MSTKKPKLIVIVGPTATGKSDLAVALARKFNGEIISADSRQVYKGFDIGSGKITKREMRGIPHHLLGVADPKRTYSVARFTRDAKKAASAIIARGKTPIVVGGTGFYIDAFVNENSLPQVPPNMALRKKLQKYSAEKLFLLLKKKDPKRAKTIDKHNKRRLIRALEIAHALGAVPKTKNNSPYNTLWIGLTLPKEKLAERIHTRLLKRMRNGMLAEVRNLHKKGLSWRRLENFGLEYGHLAQLLQKKTTEKEMLHDLEHDINRYAKRQMTWWKRNKAIRWFAPKEVAKISKLTKSFLRT